MRFNKYLIGQFIGILLLINGVFMWLCLPFSLYFKESARFALLISGGITLALGGILWFLTRQKSEKALKKRDGYLVVTLGWLAMSAVGALPYILSGSIPNYTNAFFESISGFSTTGASILNDIESLPKGILFWRSLTQWIGGMGIIVMAVAILPILGIGGMELFVAEAPGISPDKLKPRIKDTAKRLWIIYIAFTLLETLLLQYGGMSFYDALNHSLTTMATGGFSTKNSSAADFSPFIQYVLIVFMCIAGTNFTLSYFATKFRFKKIFANEEFRYYLGFTLCYTLLIAAIIYSVSENSLEKSFRDALFQVVSLVTTTGFVSADYTQWTPLVTMIMFMLMFFGASAGSTSGGVKIVRHIILLKNSLLELKRQLHPSAILLPKLNGKTVSKETTFNILAFMMIYLAIFVFGVLVMSAFGLDFMTTLGAVATSLGNIGPGLGTVGPVDNFAHLPQAGKWFLAFLMLLGRLELFTVLMLLTPYFWKKT